MKTPTEGKGMEFHIGKVCESKFIIEFLSHFIDLECSIKISTNMTFEAQTFVFRFYSQVLSSTLSNL